MSDVWKMYRKIAKDRRDLLSKLMEPYEEYFRNRYLEVQELCEKEGHDFKFTGTGPLGHVWYHCNKCGKSKVEDE